MLPKMARLLRAFCTSACAVPLLAVVCCFCLIKAYLSLSPDAIVIWLSTAFGLIWVPSALILWSPGVQHWLREGTFLQGGGLTPAAAPRADDLSTALSGAAAQGQDAVVQTGLAAALPGFDEALSSVPDEPWPVALSQLARLQVQGDFARRLELARGHSALGPAAVPAVAWCAIYQSHRSYSPWSKVDWHKANWVLHNPLLTPREVLWGLAKALHIYKWFKCPCGEVYGFRHGKGQDQEMDQRSHCHSCQLSMLEATEVEDPDLQLAPAVAAGLRFCLRLAVAFSGEEPLLSPELQGLLLGEIRELGLQWHLPTGSAAVHLAHSLWTGLKGAAFSPTMWARSLQAPEPDATWLQAPPPSSARPRPWRPCSKQPESLRGALQSTLLFWQAVPDQRQAVVDRAVGVLKSELDNMRSRGAWYREQEKNQRKAANSELAHQIAALTARVADLEAAQRVITQESGMETQLRRRLEISLEQERMERRKVETELRRRLAELSEQQVAWARETDAKCAKLLEKQEVVEETLVARTGGEPLPAPVPKWRKPKAKQPVPVQPVKEAPAQLLEQDIQVEEEVAAAAEEEVPCPDVFLLTPSASSERSQEEASGARSPSEVSGSFVLIDEAGAGDL